MYLVTETKKLLDFWAVRYAMIVDNSHRAEDCPYALGAARRHLEQEDELDKLLSGIRALVDKIYIQLPSTSLSAEEIVESYEVNHGV